MTGSAGQIRLIVNADDLGWSAGVNEGILRAHRDGIVTSATLAANMPAAAAAVERLGEHRELGVGVHLNVCQGPALSARGRAVLTGGAGEMSATGTQIIRRCLLRPRDWSPAHRFGVQTRCRRRGWPRASDR